MAVHLYVGSPLSDSPPLCCGRTAPKVSEEEGSYAPRFYCRFLEKSKSCLLLLVTLPHLIDTLAVGRFKVPAMTVYDVATKALDTVISSGQHHWPDFWDYIVLFQLVEAFPV